MEKIIKQCLFCGNDFLVDKRQEKRMIHCSHFCSYKSGYLKKKGISKEEFFKKEEDKQNSIGKQIKDYSKNCLFCFEPLTGRIRRYCSKKCRSKMRYKLNKEKFKQRTKDYYLIHRDEKQFSIKKRKYFKKYYKKNRGKINLLLKNYYHTHKEKWKIRRDDQEYILSPECYNCQSTKHLQRHHLDYNSHKIVTLCLNCHRKVHRKYNPLILS